MRFTYGVIRISRAEPSAQDQQQPVELRRAAFEVEALAGDCDSRELVGGTVFPQVQVDYSVWHATSCLRNLATSSGSSSNRYGKFGCENTFRYGFLRFLMKDIGNHWEKAYAEKLRQERPASVLYETTAIYILLPCVVL